MCAYSCMFFISLDTSSCATTKYTTTRLPTMSKRVHPETTVPISQPDAKKLRRTVAKRLDALFEKLIDKQGGPAATVEGEILRAVNTVINCSNAGKQHFSRSGDYGCTFANTFRKTLPASAVCYLATSPSVPNEVRDEFKGWAERNKYGPYMKYSEELGFHDELAVLQQITLTFIEGKDEEYEENEDDFEKYHHEAIRLGFFHDLEERFDALKRKLLVRDGEFSDEFSDGPADTVQGEMLRAVDHIIRTFKEDGGHHFAKGYGAEEAGPCMEYLTESDSIPGKVRDLFVRWAECYQCKYEYEYDDTGQKAFEELMKIAVEYIEGVGSKLRDNKEDCEEYVDGRWTLDSDSDSDNDSDSEDD